MSELIPGVFELKEEGEDKVIPLPRAIAGFIRPGMALYLTREAGAATLELCRCFWGKDAGFTLISSTMGNYAFLPIYGGLVKKAITSNYAHPYPTQGPVKVVVEAQRSGMESEIWSICVLQLRLMAGALGLPFLPTRSIRGSNLADINPENFREVTDPFTGEGVGVVRALKPDVSLVHGLAADRYGNTILPLPASELWGARAGQRIIVTVERVVSSDFIRRHAPLVKIPGHLVDAVCPAPFGAHPWGLPNTGVPEVEGYDSDYEFMLRLREALEDEEKMKKWVGEWLLGTKDHEAYLRRLGEARLSRLKESWNEGWRCLIPAVDRSPEYLPGEMTVAAASRKLKERLLSQGYRTVLCGAGTSALAAWVAYYLLQRDGRHIDLVVGSGLYGFAPRPGRPVLNDVFHIPTAKMLTDTVDAWGWVVGGSRGRSLVVLSAAQVDRRGNINSTEIEGVHLFGGGGANDATPAPEVIVVMAAHSPRRLVERVPFITVPGDRVSALITRLGVFEKRGDELCLTALFPGGPGREAGLQRIKERTGWEVRVAEDLVELPPPSEEELALVRALDPQGFYTR